MYVGVVTCARRYARLRARARGLIVATTLTKILGAHDGIKTRRRDEEWKLLPLSPTSVCTQDLQNIDICSSLFDLGCDVT